MILMSFLYQFTSKMTIKLTQLLPKLSKQHLLTTAFIKEGFWRTILVLAWFILPKTLCKCHYIHLHEHKDMASLYGVQFFSIYES